MLERTKEEEAFPWWWTSIKDSPDWEWARSGEWKGCLCNIRSSSGPCPNTGSKRSPRAKLDNPSQILQTLKNLSGKAEDAWKTFCKYFQSEAWVTFALENFYIVIWLLFSVFPLCSPFLELILNKYCNFWIHPLASLPLPCPLTLPFFLCVFFLNLLAFPFFRLISRQITLLHLHDD